MINIIVIVGESGCGKSALEKALTKKYGYKKIVSTTSRPIRSNENGDEYNFVTDDEFKELLKQNKFVEHATYNNWNYGLSIDSLRNDGVVVLTPHGLRQLRSYFNKYDLEHNFTLFSIYLKVDRKSRLIKLIQVRDDIEEAYRRNLSDIGMFAGIEDEVNIVINNSEYRLSVDTLADQAVHELEKNGEVNEEENLS